MDIDKIKSVLGSLNASSDQILISMLVSADGLPLLAEGMDADIELKGALYIELALLASRISAELGCGQTEEIFVRSKHGCVVLWPIGEVAVLACMANSGIDTYRMQMLAWKAVVRLQSIL